MEASQSSTSNNTLSSSNGDAAGSSQSSVEHEAEAEVARGAGMMKMDTDADADMDGGMVVDTKTDASRTADFKTGLGTETHGTAQYSRANGHRVTDVNGNGSGTSSGTSTGVVNGTANTLHGSAALPRLQTDTHTDEARNGLDLPDDAVARHGQKRTASGHVKTPTTATARLSTSPVRERPLSSVDQGRSHSQRHSHSQSYSYSSYSHGHKRTTSTNTQVNEVRALLPLFPLKTDSSSSRPSCAPASRTQCSKSKMAGNRARSTKSRRWPPLPPLLQALHAVQAQALVPARCRIPRWQQPRPRQRQAQAQAAVAVRGAGRVRRAAPARTPQQQRASRQHKRPGH